MDASKVTPIPEDMSYEEGAMIEPLAVAVHGVKQMGDVAGMNIAVLGAGPIGNLVAQAAKGMGLDVLSFFNGFLTALERLMPVSYTHLHSR